MRKELSNRAIGLFVVIAFAILGVFVVQYGISKYFQEERHFVLYFKGSLNGLQVGAPVKFRGVQVGEVDDIRVEYNHTTNEITLPVVITIRPNRIVDIGEPGSVLTEDEALQDLIKQGLRARLGTSSLITGALFIELDTEPDTPANLTGLHKKLPEIPTIESKSEQVGNIIETARSALASAEKLFGSKELERSIKNFDKMMVAGKETFENSREAIKNGNEAFKSGKTAFDQGTLTMKDLRKMSTNINNHIDPLAIKLTDSAHELSDTLVAIRVLADYLARHPESLLAGKKSSTKR